MPSETLSTLASTSAMTVSLARSFAGGIMLLTPQLGANLFGVPLLPGSNIVARLFGIRDLILGGLLWGARSSLVAALSKSDSTLFGISRHDLRRVLIIGILIDSVDVVSSIVSIWNRDMEGKTILWIPGGATMFVGLQWLALEM